MLTETETDFYLSVCFHSQYNVPVWNFYFWSTFIFPINILQHRPLHFQLLPLVFQVNTWQTKGLSFFQKGINILVPKMKITYTFFFYIGNTKPERFEVILWQSYFITLLLLLLLFKLLQNILNEEINNQRIFCNSFQLSASKTN